MSSVKVTFDGHAFIPQGVVDLPAGTELEILIPASFNDKTSYPLRALVEMLKTFPVNPDTPEDLAAQHDHYLYGTPKRP